MLEIKSVLSKLLKDFEFSKEADFEPELAPEIVLKSRNGIMLKIKKRCEHKGA